MREVDPIPRTSHVTPPLELSTLAAAIGRWGLARFSALPNAPGCVCDARPGCGTKPCPPPTPDTGGTATCPGGALLPPPSLPLMSLWGPGGVTPVPFPSGGPVASFSSLLPRTRVYSGSPGRLGSGTASALRGVKAYVRLSPLPWSPLSVPSYPPRCGGGLVHPPFPTAHLRPPLPWHALYVLYYVYASACPVCGMGACGVCVVSGCECDLRVGCVELPRLVVGGASVPRVGLSSPAPKGWRRSRPIGLVGDGCLPGNSPASPCLRFARP